MKLNFQIQLGNLKPADADTKQYIETLMTGSFLELEKKEESTGSVPMLRTWRGWMRETARHMAHMGCTMPLYFDSKGNPHGSRPFNEYDAHELFTSRYLGADEEGRRKSWSMSREGDTVRASKSDRLWAMNTHLDWCCERGIKLTIPKNSEFEKLNQKDAA